MPASVPPPSGAPDRSSGRRDRVFLRRCAGYGGGIGMPPRSDGQSDGHHLCPSRDAALSPQSVADAPRRRPPRWRPAAWCRGRWLQRWWPPRDRRRLPPRGSVSPLFAPVGGVAAHQVASHPGLAHSRVGGLPLPINSPQLVTTRNQHGPQARQNAALAPRLEVAMHGAIVPKARGPLIPLAASAQPEDEAIQHRAQVDATMPLGPGGITRIEDQLDHLPYVVRNFPDRWLGCGLHDNPPFL